MRSSITSEKSARARIEKEVRYQHHFRKGDENVFLANCDTWEKQGAHCHLGKKHKNTSNELRQIRLDAGRHRSASQQNF